MTRACRSESLHLLREARTVIKLSFGAGALAESADAFGAVNRYPQRRGLGNSQAAGWAAKHVSDLTLAMLRSVGDQR
jgi:hypothetical protein